MVLSTRTLATLLLLGWMIAAAETAEKTGEAKQPNTWSLAFKFTANQTVHYHDQLHSTIHLQKGDKTVRILNNRESRNHYRVLSVDEQGRGLIETVTDHVKIHAKNGDEPAIRIDSSNSLDTCPANFRPLLASVGRPIARSRCATSGELVRVISVSKSWLNAHPGNSNQSLAKSLQKQGFLVPLPDKPVAIGDTWDEPLEANAADDVGKRYKISLKKIYSLKQVKNGLATIGWKTVRLTPITDPRLLAQLVQLLSTGEVVLDLKQGVVLSKTSHIDQTLVGPFGADTLMTALTKHELVLREGN